MLVLFGMFVRFGDMFVTFGDVKVFIYILVKAILVNRFLINRSENCVLAKVCYTRR